MTDDAVPCPACGRLHNLIRRTAGDLIICGCGARLWVLFAPARLVLAGNEARWWDDAP